MAERPFDKQNWQGRSLTSFGPKFRIDMNNPQMGCNGTEVYNLYAVTNNNDVCLTGLTEGGNYRLYNDRSIEIIAGQKSESNGVDIIISGRNGDVCITAEKNGRVRIRAQNIMIDADEDVSTFDSNIIRRKSFTATAGQTVFTADLPFIDGFEQIFMNGLLLVKTTDYATSGGNTVTLTSGASASDVIEIVSVTGANSIDTYTQAETNALLAANTSVAPLSISANTTLVAKKRYFVTSASALTLTLPASPALNDEIQILDASGNSSTYNITVARNANKINGGNNNLIIDTNGGWYTLLYTGSTYGWKVG